MIRVIRTLVIVAVVAVIGAAVLWHPPPRPAWTMPSPSPSAAHARWSEESAHPQAAIVYVAGAVRTPGLYAVRTGARAADAVRSAGGLLPNADAASVNLAARVSDGDEVEVAVAGQRVTRSRSSSSYRRARSRSRSRSRSRTGHGFGHGKSSVSPDSGDGQNPVDVNAADVDALAAVPGIGPSIAGRIVEMRGRVGPFATLDELLDVSGMTQSRLERARQYLRDP
jgi:competence protein ComEA